MSPQLRAQIELTPEMLAQLDRMFGTPKQQASRAVVTRSRIHGLEGLNRETP